MMNIKSGAMEQYREYSRFSSLTEFNRHMEQWLAEHKKDFSKGELLGLKRLVRFAAKIPGVCHAKIGTILKVIHEECNENGISRSTFKRMLGKAKKLGLLFVYETERKNGSQSSNLYVFHRFPQNELPKEEKMDHPNETSNLSKTKKIKDLKKRKEEPIRLDHSYTSDYVPKPFVQLVQSYYNDAKIIEEYWRMTRIAASNYNSENEPELILTTAIASFKQLVTKIKKIHKPIAYYYGIISQKLHDHLYQERYEMSREFEDYCGERPYNTYYENQAAFLIKKGIIA
jgi:N-acetylglutamate synthase-like GNAT family acetyltransferase